MMSAFDLQAFLQERRDAVQAGLAELFAEDGMPSVLREAMEYSLLSSGKRLRPLLVLAAAESFHVDTKDALSAALAVELIHCYSLIHDDLPEMDDDDLRRGRPTNHKVFGQATALLAGDGLLTYAFEQLSKPLPVPASRQLEMIRVLAAAAGPYGMVGGQQADMMAEGKHGTLEDLMYIHSRKTGALIRASVVIGSLFADLPPEQRNALYTYGERIGFAFQLMDDWLDVVSDTESLGKTAGRDEAVQKLTWPSVVGLDETHRRAQACVDQACEALQDADVDAPALVALARYVTERTK